MNGLHIKTKICRIQIKHYFEEKFQSYMLTVEKKEKIKLSIQFKKLGKKPKQYTMKETIQNKSWDIVNQKQRHNTEYSQN